VGGEIFPLQTQGFVPEAMVTPFEEAGPKAGKGQVYFVCNGKVFGSGNHVSYDKNKFLLTAHHVWTEAMAKLVEGSEVLLCSRAGVAVPLENYKLECFSYDKDFDYAVASLQPAVWAKLEVRALTIATKDLVPYVTVVGIRDGKWVMSTGSVNDKNGLFRVYHTASTIPSFSGAALTNFEGKMVSMHLGHRDGRNEAVSMHPIIQSLQKVVKFTPESDIISSVWKRSDAEELYDSDAEEYAVYYADGGKSVYRSAPSGHYDTSEFVIGTEGMRNYKPAYGMSWAEQIEEDEFEWDPYMSNETGAEPAPEVKRSKGKGKKKRAQKKMVLESGVQDFPGSLQVVEPQTPSLSSTDGSPIQWVSCACCSSVDTRPCQRLEVDPRNPREVFLSDTLLYHNTSDLLAEEGTHQALELWRHSQSLPVGDGPWETWTDSVDLYSRTPLLELRQRSNQKADSVVRRLDELAEEQGSWEDLVDLAWDVDRDVELAVLAFETEIMMLRRLLHASSAMLRTYEWRIDRLTTERS